MLDGVRERVVVCGHTHQQFDLRAASSACSTPAASACPTRATAAAFWLLLGPDVELRRTDYDIPAAVEAMRATGMPDVDEVLLQESLIEPADPDWVTQLLRDRRDVERYSPVLRSGVRSSGSASSISLVKMRSPRL